MDITTTDRPGVAITPAVRWARPPLGPHTLAIAFAVVNLIMIGLPLGRTLAGHGTSKDYPLWYDIGQAVLRGGDLYHSDFDRAVLVPLSAVRGGAAGAVRRVRAGVLGVLPVSGDSGQLAGVGAALRPAVGRRRSEGLVDSRPAVAGLPAVHLRHVRPRPAQSDAARDRAGGSPPASGGTAVVRGGDVRGGGGAEGLPDRHPALSDLAAALGLGGLDGPVHPRLPVPGPGALPRLRAQSGGDEDLVAGHGVFIEREGIRAAAGAELGLEE